MPKYEDATARLETALMGDFQERVQVRVTQTKTFLGISEAGLKVCFFHRGNGAMVIVRIVSNDVSHVRQHGRADIHGAAHGVGRPPMSRLVRRSPSQSYRRTNDGHRTLS